ncbi:MAG: DNA sulfur modification protein DndD [Bacteroidales bacterium]|nr:DNA sulfur modification protein DndD [Bacteroidales bacterium]
MIITRVKAHNYKTYLDLDLDLTVEAERPIILIGGMNGGGKTTLFEAIYGALYGLNIANERQFQELLNAGAPPTEKPEIVLELSFKGLVTGTEQKYNLRRTYRVMSSRPVENVRLNLNGNVVSYGTQTPAGERHRYEQMLNKIIKANLPQELSKYFLFDAMQSSELLKEGVFSQIIRDNIQNVMGFNKYLMLKHAAEKLHQKKAAERIKAKKEREEYERLCAEKEQKVQRKTALEAALDQSSRRLQEMQEAYDAAREGARKDANARQRISEIDAKINEANSSAERYCTEAKDLVDNLEGSVFLPKLASQLSQEIANIVRIKDSLKKEPIESPQQLRDITHRVLDLLRQMQLLDANANEEDIIAQLISRRCADGKDDPYAILEDDDVAALVGLVNSGGHNTFPHLSESKMACETKLGNLDEWHRQRYFLQQSIDGNDQEVINNYETEAENQRNIEIEIENLTVEIQRLDNRIHTFDIQIQEEPDLKFDTLVKLRPFFEDVAKTLLQRKRQQIETQMQEQLNILLLSYKGHIQRVEISENLEDFSIKIFHSAGNEIALSQLNAASKQIFIQVLLKILRNLGDYNPPVMIDTVMGVLDNESRDALMQEYFPQLADQTILLCTTSEIRKDSDYKQIEAFISKTYTLQRDVALQRTEVVEGYFGTPLNRD